MQHVGQHCAPRNPRECPELRAWCDAQSARAEAAGKPAGWDGETCHHISAVAHPGRALGQRCRLSSNLCMQAHSMPPWGGAAERRGAPRAAALCSPPLRPARRCRPPAGDGAQSHQHGQQQAGQAGAHEPRQHLLPCIPDIQRCQAARNLGAAPGSGLCTAIHRVHKQGRRTPRAACSARALSGACPTHSAWDRSARVSAARAPSSRPGAGSRAILQRRSLAEPHTCSGKLAAASRLHARRSAPVGEAVGRSCQGLQQPGLPLPRRRQARRRRCGLRQQVGQAAARPRQVPYQQRQLVGRVAALCFALRPRPARLCRPCTRRSYRGPPPAIFAMQAAPCPRSRLAACAARQPLHRG